MRSPRRPLLVATVLTLGVPAALPLLPAAAQPADDLAITSVRLDTTVDSWPSASGGDIRQRSACSVEVSFEDAHPRDPENNGYYELRVPGMEYGVARAYLWDDADPETISTYGCSDFAPGQPTELTLHYVEYDEDAGPEGDEVDLASSAPATFTLEEIEQPTGATIGAPGVDSTGETMETGTEAVISFEGSWAADADVTAKITTTQGWKSLSKQDAQEREVPATWDPATQTFTFIPDSSLAGRTLYVTVKGAAPAGDRAGTVWTWAPRLLVAPGAKPTKRSWVQTFGKIDRKRDRMFLHTTKARATRAGQKAGVRFAYQGWWGETTFYSWHSSARAAAVGEYGGCPNVTQQVRVLAFVPGRPPAARTISMDPPGCRTSLRAQAGGSATGVGTWQ